MIATETAEARILLVDDHPMLRHGLASYINQQEGLLVCGEAENLEQGLSRIESLDPGLVIVDITLRGSDGIELIRRIRADGNQVPILVLSMHDESLYAERVLRTGANGYIMKEEPVRRLSKPSSRCSTAVPGSARGWPPCSSSGPWLAKPLAGHRFLISVTASWKSFA